MAEGRCEDGVAALEQALRIALDLSNVDDIGRAYVNLSDALFFSGEGARAAEVVDEGVRVAESVGIASSYGSVIRQNGVLYAFDLGHWAEASRLAADSFAIQHASPLNDRYGLARWVGLLVAMGDETAAARLDQLDRLLEGLPVESQFSGPYHAARAEFALWQARPADALGSVRLGLAQISHSDWYKYHLHLLRLGARATADLADVARARRDPVAEHDAIRAGDEIQRVLQADPRYEPRPTVRSRCAGDPRRSRDDRGGGCSDAPRAGHGCLARGGRPMGRAPATVPRSLLSLARGRGHARERRPLRRGDRLAPGARDRDRARRPRPLRTEIESLAARARIALATLVVVAPGPAAASDGPPDPNLVQRRSPIHSASRGGGDVIALVSIGRTNRRSRGTVHQPSTAGVHVSNILRKLGVASRTEAAGIAARLGLGPP